MAVTKRTTGDALEIVRLETESAGFAILGRSPLLYHRMAEKAKRDLLGGGRRKTKAEKEQTIKHDPLVEYRASVYADRTPTPLFPVDGIEQPMLPPTRLVFPAGGFKQALATAALETPGATKTQIGRLVWIEGRNIHVYGVPKLSMMGVRNSDVRRTPDIRTRAILPEWAALVTFTYVIPQLNAVQIGNLLASAGLIIGIGDGRQEKGALSFGQFEPVPPDHPDVVRIMAEGGREAQDAALADPEPIDDETAELLEWYEYEMRRRGHPLRSVA